VHAPGIIAAASVECNSTAAVQVEQCDDGSGSSVSWQSCKDTRRPAVSQRNLIYIVGAIIVIIVVVYFLRT
jgi:hypothetical protein